MYTLLRIWSTAVFGLVVAFLVLAAIMSVFEPDFASAFATWLAVAGVFLGFATLDEAGFSACLSAESSALCQQSLDSLGGFARDSAGTTFTYLIGILLASALVYVAARGLERWRIAELVVRKLDAVDETYVRDVLGIRGSDSESARSETELTRRASGYSARVLTNESWQSYYDQYAKPSIGGSVLLAVRVCVIIYLIVATWFATFSMQFWVLPLTVGLAVIGLAYVRDERWKKVYAHMGASETNMALFVIYALVFSAVGYVVSVVFGFILGSRVFAEKWLPGLSIFLWIAIALAVLGPLSNYWIVRHRMHADADSTVDGLFRELRARGVRGTHAFAVCESCGSMNTLVLQRTGDCESCLRPVDMSMSVRTVSV